MSAGKTRMEDKQKIENGFGTCLLPLKGIALMFSTPSLRQIVLHFLLVVLSVSIATTFAAFLLLWNFHMRLISGYFQYVLTARLVSAALILAEAAIPPAIVFGSRFESVQHQLFDETLKLKNVRPEKTTQVVNKELNNATTNPDSPLHKVHEPKFMRLLKPVNTVYQVLFSSRVAQTFGISKTLTTRTLGSFLPFLIPILVFRDSAWLAADLMKRYWELKGVTSQEALKILESEHAWEYRGFGMMAAALNYIPILSWALGLTNSVGAALFAARLEERNSKRQ